MRRCILAVLCLLCLLPLIACRSHKPVYAGSAAVRAEGYTPEQILSYFAGIAFGSEYGGYRGTLCKWEDEIALWIDGEYGEDEVAVVADLMDRLNGIDGFPGIRYAETEAAANFRLHFVMQGDLTDYFGERAETSSGMSQFSFQKSTGIILEAQAGVASNITPENAKMSVICEELLQSLGLTSDSYAFPESVFYEGYNGSVRPAPIDWALLEILYHETITPGMAYGEAMEAAAFLLGIPYAKTEEEETVYG